MHKGYLPVPFPNFIMTVKVILGRVYFSTSNFSETVQDTAKVTTDHL